MRKTLAVCALTLAFFTVPALAQPQAEPAKKAPAASSQKMAMPAGKNLFSQKEFDFYLKQREAQGVQDSPKLREAIREELNTRSLLIKEARKIGLEKKPAVKSEMDIASQMVLIRAFIADWAQKNPVTDEQLQEQYQMLKAQLGDKEYKVAHILVQTPAEADKVLAALKAGKNFADVAKEYSKDPGSETKGGELGWHSPADFVPAFGKALASIPKGTYTTTPVKSEFGYHIIKVEDVRAAKLPTFDELKTQLRQRAQAAKLDEYFKALRKKAGV